MQEVSIKIKAGYGVFGKYTAICADRHLAVCLQRKACNLSNRVPCQQSHIDAKRGLLHYLLTYLFLSLVDRWGTKDDQATTVFHSSLFSAFRRTSPNFNPVHSVTLSSHLFFCLPLLLPPCTVPCRIIFASCNGPRVMQRRDRRRKIQHAI